MSRKKFYQGNMSRTGILEGLISVVILVLTSFGLRYTIGSNKTQK